MGDLKIRRAAAASSRRSDPRSPASRYGRPVTSADAPSTRPVEPAPHEPRWPVALTLGTFIAISIVLRVAEPQPRVARPASGSSLRSRSGCSSSWCSPTRPTSKGGGTGSGRVSITLVGALTAVALVSTVVLVTDLIQGGPVTNEASSLLASGAIIWLGNALVFSLLYWLLDSGGPYARYIGEHEYPDFAFTQHQSPELVPPDWRPHYVDYLVLGLTTNTAFSPTDVMPLARWAKLAMAVQSLIALTVVGLVIARAVNVFA